jgi:cytosine/adenosine deaminase-related metal-dependent hydrolase
MADTLVLKHAPLIDGTGAEPRENVTVVVADGVIREIGESGAGSSGRVFALKARERIVKAEILGAMGAIVSATRANAELLNVADTLGTNEVEKLADLIVIDGYPRRDIGRFGDARNSVRLALKGGRIMKDLLG